jgi:TolB-like protein/class 3 adenylate cyclase
MGSGDVERRLAAILSADVVGYSRLMARDEVSTVRMITAYRDQMEVLIRQHRGRIVDSPGDNVLAEFPSATDALESAGEIQRVLQARNAPLPPERRMEFRVGVHLGEVMVEGERIYGDGVNLAARLEGLAEPGGICISSTVHDQVESKVRLRYEDLGEREVKNIERPVHVYRARWETVESAPTADGPSAKSSPRAVLLVAATVILLLALGVGAWLLYSRYAPAPESGQIRSIAVLPLENLSGDPEQEYFADGMTEALIGGLAKIGSLRVISRTSVMQYKGTRRPLPEIARELNVDSVVEGTVSREGDRVRVTAQLIDARSDAHLWSERFDRDIRGVLALQSEVAQAIARGIHVTLSPEEMARLSQHRQVDPAAHEAYLKGRYFFSKYTIEDVRTAIGYFEQAIEGGPAYAPAHAWLSRSYQALSMSLMDIPQREGFPKARAAAVRALELDDTLASAHFALGRVHLYFDWDWDGAEKELRRAIELDPSLSAARSAYADYLEAMGRHREALEEARRGVEVAPLDLLARTHLAGILFFAHEFDRGIEEVRKILEVDPDFQYAHLWLAWLNEYRRNYEEALDARARWMILSSYYDEEDAIALRAAYEASGPEGYWQGILRAQERRARSRRVHPVNIVWTLVALGDQERAFEMLERGFEERDTNLIWLGVDPAFDPIRSDPRFDDLLRRVGLPHSG